MNADLIKISEKVKKYQEILDNATTYRKAWNKSLKKLIKSTLEEIAKETGLKAEVEIQDNVENMEVIIFNLGMATSGMSEKVDKTVRKPMIKSNGGLIYQQLFNGKILILIALPFIEGYGEPRPPITVEILRPEELKKPFIYRHVEKFLKSVTEWEDYDDDIPQQAPNFNPIGFNKANQMEGE